MTGGGPRQAIEVRPDEVVIPRHSAFSPGTVSSTSASTSRKGFASSVPPVAAATADVAEVRFHGRDAELWEAQDVGPAERHHYDYRREELAEWVPRIELLVMSEGRPVHVLMNNCAGGHRVRNAHTLAGLLADELR